jgi:hypothetical protein
VKATIVKLSKYMKKVRFFLTIFLLINFLYPINSYAETGHSAQEEQLERPQAQPSQQSVHPLKNK